MAPRRLVLASASRARARQLRAAGFDPEIVPSDVDENIDIDDVATLVLTLAERKADAVATRCGTALVIGCDSLLEIDGQPAGKPASAGAAIAEWHAMRGREGHLRTGHCVIDGSTGARASAVASTLVRFGSPTDAEIEAYIGTGEPLAVAGAFTLDGRSAPFIDGIDGDPGAVIGLSLPTLRRLLVEVGVSLTSLWT